MCLRHHSSLPKTAKGYLQLIAVSASASAGLGDRYAEDHLRNSFSLRHCCCTYFSSHAPTHVPTCLSSHAPTHVPTCLSSHAPTHVPTCLSSHAPTHVPTCLSSHAPTHVPTCLSSHAPTHASARDMQLAHLARISRVGPTSVCKAQASLRKHRLSGCKSPLAKDLSLPRVDHCQWLPKPFYQYSRLCPCSHCMP